MTRHDDILDRLAPSFEPFDHPYERFTQRLERRDRNRRVGALMLVAVLVAGLVAVGLRAMDGDRVPAEPPPRLTSGSVGSVELSFPADWTLTGVDAPLNPARPPLDLLLSNVRLEDGSEDLCAAVPPGGVALRVGQIPGGAGGQPWPVPLDPVVPPATCTAEQLEATWLQDDRTYRATVVMGAIAAETDRDGVIAAFGSLRFLRPGTEVVTAPSVVLASGDIEGRPWSLTAVATTTDEAVAPSVLIQTSPGTSGGGARLMDAPVEGHLAISDSTLLGRHSFLLGYVGVDVARVEVAVEGGPRARVELHDVPLGFEHPIRAFVLPLIGAVTGTATAYDASGTDLTTVGFAPGVRCGQRREPRFSPWVYPCRDQADPILLEGMAEGVEWRLSEEAGQMVMRDAAGAIVGRVTPGTQPLAVGLSDLRYRDRPIAFGVASPPVTNVIWYSTAGFTSTARGTLLADGRLVFVADGYADYGEPGRLLLTGFDRSCEPVIAIDLVDLDPVDPTTLRCGSVVRS